MLDVMLGKNKVKVIQLLEGWGGKNNSTNKEMRQLSVATRSYGLVDSAMDDSNLMPDI